MQIQGAFQSQINDYQTPGVAGDFASTNPYSSVLAGPGKNVAPVGGLEIGNFAWFNTDGSVSQGYVAGAQIGFISRHQQALITGFLSPASMQIPQGFMVDGKNTGDYWAFFADGANVGDTVYADAATGAPISGNNQGAGTGVQGFTGTATLVANSAVLTVAAATTGILSPGDTVTGTDIPANTTILNQLTGTAGKVGTYTMSAEATATVGSAEAIVGHSNFMLVTAMSAGEFEVGDPVSGTSVGAGTTITGQAIPFSGVATLATSTALNVTAVQPGTDLLRVGATVAGPGIPAGTTISSQTSGTPGGVGAYVLSAASTLTQADVAITTTDAPGLTGLYTTNVNQQYSATTVTVVGSPVATQFKVRGVYQAGDGIIAKISSN